jgi:hypothetical protein
MALARGTRGTIAIATSTAAATSAAAIANAR